MTRDLTHERCAQRCCCPSWSCEHHRADCEVVTGRHVYAAGGIVSADAAERIVRNIERAWDVA